MRLIDVDTIKTIDYSGLASISPNDYKGVANYFYDQLIVNQPTAYDVDKVVERLENEPSCGFGFKGLYTRRVIEIVKGAVKDE